jgi:hypothetical protein
LEAAGDLAWQCRAAICLEGSIAQPQGERRQILLRSPARRAGRCPDRKKSAARAQAGPLDAGDREEPRGGGGAEVTASPRPAFESLRARQFGIRYRRQIPTILRLELR